MESSDNKEQDYNISLLVSMTRVPIRLHKIRSRIADAFSLIRDLQTIHHCFKGCYSVRTAILQLRSVIVDEVLTYLCQHYNLTQNLNRNIY